MMMENRHNRTDNCCKVLSDEEKLHSMDNYHLSKNEIPADINVPTVMVSDLPERHPEHIQILLNLLVDNCQLTTLQYDTVFKYLSKQRNEQIKIEFGKDASQALCVCGGRQVNVTDMPNLVLRLIFSFLPAYDLVNVQKVCKPWRALTMDTIMWKHAPVYVHSGKHMGPFRMPLLVPYLHTITGYCDHGSELINTLVNNVTDLRRMDCCACDASEVDIQCFLRKFRNIEFMQINNMELGYVATLDILNACPNLKGLKFMYNSRKDNFPQVSNVISDGFVALTELHISRICKGKYHFALSHMMRKKISQLEQLSLDYSDIDFDVLELIFKSTRLEKLEIDGLLPDVSLNLENMMNLKSLALRFVYHTALSKKSDYFSENTYKKIVFPRNVEHFKISFFKAECSKLYKGVITDITSSLPNLKTLVIKSVNDHDIDQQLGKIGNLQNLHSVEISSCPHLTAKGMEYITQCAALRQLNVSRVSLVDSTYECLKNCTYLVDLYLYECVLNTDKLLPAIFLMKYLSNIRFDNCTDESNWTIIETSKVNNIMQKCGHNKHYVNIKC